MKSTRTIRADGTGLHAHLEKNSQLHDMSYRQARNAVKQKLPAHPVTIHKKMITFNSTVAKWSGAYGNVKIAKLKIISSLSNVAVKQAVHGDVMHEMSVVMHLQGGHQCLPYVFGIIDEKTLVMELVSDESCSVNHHVQSNSFSTQQRLRICYEFADGLSYIHSKGIMTFMQTIC